MRSIANFPTGINRRRGRTMPNRDNHKPSSNNNSGNADGWSQSPPVWGRSAASFLSFSSSPSNSSSDYESGSGSDTDSTRSASRSPVPQSPIWGRPAGTVTVTASTRSPHRKRRSREEHEQQQTQQQKHAQRASLHNRTLSPVMVLDYQDEVIGISHSTTHPPQQKQQQQQQLQLQQHHQLLAPARISSPRIPHELCTIAEDRNISSNTLSEMAVTSTAREIAESPVLAKRPPPKRAPTRIRTHDPYKEDSCDDPGDKDCAGCWWPFGKIPSNNNNSNRNTGRTWSRNRMGGFSNGNRRIHLRRTSF